METGADFASFIVREVNAGLFKDFLYLEDRGEVSFHNSFILLDPLKRRRRLIVHILAGTNDIRAAPSAATIYSFLQTYVNNVHALRSNAKVIVGVNLVQCDIYNRSNELGVLETLNAHIIAGWNVAQGSGGLGADGLADYWANTTIGPGNYNGSTFCNYPNSYSRDGAHRTVLSMSIMGSIEAAAVQPLLP